MVSTPTIRRASTSREFVYNAPPIISAFMNSKSFGRLLVGPVGSGKTTACIVELSKMMMNQSPAALDGKRYTRFAIIRQTLKQMKDTVLRDVQHRFGTFMDWRVSESIAYFREGDVHSEWMFIPLDEPEDRKRLLSTNLTAAFINEAVEIDLELLSDIAGRVGRYPNEEFGVPTQRCIIADTNMPVEFTAWADFIKAGLRNEIPEWQIFRQPGGRHPDAENLAHLEQTPESILLPESDPARSSQGRKYYERLVATGTPEYIRRFVDAEFGRDLTGSAVFNESFDYNFHIRPYLDPLDVKMLVIGQDFGRNPASVITQPNGSGRLFVLDEIASYDIGLYQHLKERLLPLLACERYIGKRFIVIGDPAGIAQSTLFDINEFKMMTDLNIPCLPAATNEIDRRLSSVERAFLAQYKGEAAVLIDESRCPVLVEGLNGAYRFARNKDGVSQNVPEKNTPYSHVQDAMQYATMTALNNTALQYAFTQTIVRPKRQRPKVSARGWT